MEQKLLIQVIELVYMLNDQKGKNRAVLKMNGKALFIAIYSNFWEDIDLSDSLEIYFGKYNTCQRLKDAKERILYYINEQAK